MRIENNRVEWIDSLKGLLLIFITFSHFGYLPPFIKLFIKPTGIVWVPCFFFLSGLLFSLGHYPKFIDYLKKKTRTLLVPYLFMSILFLFLDWNNYIHPKIYLHASLISILNGSGPPKASPLWFVFTLYCINLMYYWIDRNLSTKLSKTLAIMFFSIVGYICYLQNIHLPFHLEITFSALTFMGIGNIFKDNILHFYKTITLNNIACISTSVLLFYISKISAEWNLGGILGQNKINNYFFFYVSSFSGLFGISILGSFAWLLLNHLSYTNWMLKIMNYISLNALPILAAQCYVIILVSETFKYIWSDPKFELIEFFTKTAALIFSMYLIIIPFSFNKIYFIFGKEKQSWSKLLAFK